jgi:tRNA (guanine37-N1)-methyltransferase
VLLSGDHAAIARYRLVETVKLTLERRPELLLDVSFTPAEQKILKKEGLLGRIETIVREYRTERSSAG